jgi:hypothetical protein
VQNPFNTVIHILLDESSELRKLAQLTDLPVRDFYRGADLRGVNLSGQDLKGLNFQKADLRGAKLDNITYDPGAFNGALLDDQLTSMIDEYDFFIEDIDEDVFSRISIMYRFRPILIDEILSAAGVSYRQFSENANISTATLRRVRLGKAIANESVFGVIEAVRDVLSKTEFFTSYFRTASERDLQPAVNVGYYDPGGVWINVTTEDFRRLAWILNEVNSVRFGVDWRSKPKSLEWNMKPPSLEWAYNFYVLHDYAIPLYDDRRVPYQEFIDNRKGDLLDL